MEAILAEVADILAEVVVIEVVEEDMEMEAILVKQVDMELAVEVMLMAVEEFVS